MKFVFFIVIALVSTSTFAASKKVVDCSNKYERFSITIEDESTVVIERSVWERTYAMSVSKKIEFYGEEVKISKNGIEFFVNAHSPSNISVHMGLIPNNENNILLATITSDDESSLSLINKALNITEDNAITFDQDECTFSSTKKQ